MIKLRIILTGIVATLAACCPFSLQPSESEDYISTLFHRANEAYEKGIELEGEARKKELGISAVNYERIIGQDRLENGYLYYNLGNTYFHLGELGKSILNYRRAERYLKNFPELRENLKTAIARREDKIESGQIESIWRTLFFWHYLLSFSTKVILFAVFFTFIWLVFFIRLYWSNLALKWVTGFIILLSVSFGLSFTIESYVRVYEKYGVITEQKVDARKGPYRNAQSEFKTPLHDGTEFKLLEERRDWYQIELKNGISTWIPKQTCELI